MNDHLLSRLESATLLAWVVATSALLLGASSGALRNPSLPIQFGWIHSTGAAALWEIVLPGLCGVAAAVALLQKRAGASLLVLVYSLYWLLLLLGGLAQAAFHTTNHALARIPLHTWVTGSAIFLTMTAAFFLALLWAVARLRAWQSGEDAF